MDDLASTPAWGMAPTEQGEALLTLTRALNRLAEVRLRVLTASDRNEVGTETGATSTAAWLAHETATTTASVLADVHLAQALDTDFEATRAALAVGVIDVAKARVI
ncbi:MAG: hypothetical protein ACTHOK_12345, partial [Nocardioidaceae bacterium]